MHLMSMAVLKPHEMIDDARLLAILDEIREYGIVPIVVDVVTGTILDGHHRYRAMELLGYDTIPVFPVDYLDESIRVASWRDDRSITKEQVVRCAQCGELLPPKTTRHTIGCEIRTRVPLTTLN